MSSVRVAIVGVGNCASSLVQGVEYYKDADPADFVPGLMHVQFGEYHVRDVQFVAAFDVDGKKVGLDLAEAAWVDARDEFDWAAGMDHYIIHQVSKVHTRLVCERLGIDQAKVPLTYPRLGNVGPAAIPITLAETAPSIVAGERVLCMGIGSGLNTSFTEIVW